MSISSATRGGSALVCASHCHCDMPEVTGDVIDDTRQHIELALERAGFATRLTSRYALHAPLSPVSHHCFRATDFVDEQLRARGRSSNTPGGVRGRQRGGSRQRRLCGGERGDDVRGALGSDTGMFGE